MKTRIKNMLASIKVWFSLYWVEFVSISLSVIIATLIAVAIITGGMANGN